MIAHKNSGNQGANHWRQKALFSSLLLMMVSVFISRAALSSSTILFVVLALVHKDFLSHTRRFFANVYWLFFSLLFFIPLISGLWSSDIGKWSDVVRIKLPLLFLPLAFAGEWKLTSKQWWIICWGFLAMIFVGCVWGLIDYSQHAVQIHEEYKRAKTIITPLEDDHVRFSWLVSVAVILCLFLFHRSGHKSERSLSLIVATFFVAYLHILSARTGLFSLYLFLLLYAGWLLLQVKSRKWALTILALVLALPLLAYAVLPTFRTRLHYVLYDLSFAQKSEYLPGTSDGARVMSLKAGWQVLQQNPFGAGAGDIMHEADGWYAVNVPEVLANDKFYPSSEWLMYGGFAGWIGIGLFSIVMLLPFFFKQKIQKIFWIGFHATAAFSFSFDMGLEVQYGVFLYAFICGWWWKMFKDEKLPAQ